MFFLSEHKISLQMLERAFYDRLPLWEASISGVASVRFRAKDEGRQILLERAQAEFEYALHDPQHYWQIVQPQQQKKNARKET